MEHLAPAASRPSHAGSDADLVAALRPATSGRSRRSWRATTADDAARRAPYVRDRAVAEEVVQETWLGVLNGIDRFEGRSSLKTWIFRILVNRAKTRGVREAAACRSRRSAGPRATSRPSTPDRFLDRRPAAGPATGPPRPRAWDLPEERVLGRETLRARARAIERCRPASAR